MRVFIERIKKVVIITLVIVLLLMVTPQSIQALPSLDQENTMDFQTMFDHHGLMMMVLDPDTGDIVKANRAAEDFYGYDAGILETMKIQEINQLSPEEVQQRREEAVREKQNKFIFPHGLANGEVRTVEVYTWPFMESGRPLLYSIIFDITTEIEAQAALSARNRQFVALVSVVMLLLFFIIVGLTITKKSLKKKTQDLEISLDQLQTLIDASQTAVWRYDLKTGEHWYSPEYFSLRGMERKDFDSLENKNLEAIWLSHLHPDDREQALNGYLNFIKDPQGMYESDYRMKHVDGHWVWILSRGRRLRDKNKNGIDQLMGINVDITAQKKGEEDLRGAVKAAEAALSVKNNFLSNMSHELRTPLNGLCGMLQLLQMTDQTKDQSELSGMALESANALTALVNDILLYCKLDEDVDNSDQRIFNPVNLVKEVVSLYQHKVVEKGLSLELNTSDQVPDLVKGDVLNARHVLIHTISNAVKFTRQGKISVSVDMAGGDNQEELQLYITVHDTGIGMDEATMGRMFEPFYQGDEVHHKRFAGAGLGLAIAKNLAIKMGGSIKVKSVVGEGSCLMITIPVIWFDG